VISSCGDAYVNLAGLSAQSQSQTAKTIQMWERLRQVQEDEGRKASIRAITSS